MTAQLSIFPLTASMDGTTAGITPLTDGSSNGATNPFTQLLQGMVASLEGQDQQQSLPFFPGLSVTTTLNEEGKLLPQDGQALAPQQYINPYMALNQVDIEQLATSLELEGDLLAGKSRSALPAQLANVLQQLADNKSSNLKTEQLALNLSDYTPVAGKAMAEVNGSQKVDQVMAAMTARLAGAVEQVTSNKAEALSNPSQFSTQLLNNNLSNVNSLNAVSARPEMTMPAMTVPPQHPGWSQAVGERVQWMVNQQIQKAEIRLDPPDLGSLEVRVVMQKENAQVSFAAPNAQVREALEAALPRLREMLGEQGIDLANVDIGHHSFAEQREQNTADEFSTRDNQASGSNDVVDEAAEEEGLTIVKSSDGLLDTYV